MQQAIYNTINGITIQTTTTKITAGSRRAGLGRLARKWDLVGVLALMGSSAAYGVFALAHVGL